MSDSDSKDSDDGIRYKTQSVRNKSKLTKFPRKRSRDRHYKNADGSRYRKRYSRSPSPKKSNVKKSEKSRKKKRRSSTSSSDDKSRSKSAMKKSKQEHKTSSKNIILHLQTKSSTIKDQKQDHQKEIIGPALPPRLLQVKKNETPESSRMSKPNTDFNLDSNLRVNEITDSIGPKLPLDRINITISDIKTDIQQNQQALKDVHHPQIPPRLLNTDKSSMKEQDFDSSLQSRTVSSLTSSSQSEEKYDNQMIGPSLPVHLRKNLQQGNDDNCPESNLQGEEHSPQQSSSTASSQCQGNDAVQVLGPSLPSHLRKTLQQGSDDDCPESNLQGEEHSPQHSSSTASNQCQENDTVQVLGPSLPPHLRKNLQQGNDDDCSESNMLGEEPSQSHSSLLTSNQCQVKVLGPNLPPHLRQKLQEESCFQSNMEIEEEEDVYGPLPPGMSRSLSHKALEERALQMKIDQLEPQGSNEPTRESWMIELPTAAANFGLGPRQFKNRSGPDLSDRSSWTDLPGDKKKKKSEDVPMDLKAEAELRELKKRDEEQELLTKKHKRKEKSLLKIHKEKLEKEKKDDKPGERRPFSRDVDLQVNKFDDAQKKAIMKKAQLLDNRFSSGKSKYL